jgi:hypothetical protein
MDCHHRISYAPRVVSKTQVEVLQGTRTWYRTYYSQSVWWVVDGCQVLLFNLPGYQYSSLYRYFIIRSRLLYVVRNLARELYMRSSLHPFLESYQVASPESCYHRAFARCRSQFSLGHTSLKLMLSLKSVIKTKISCFLVLQ